jgi:hypothetical protein
VFLRFWAVPGFSSRIYEKKVVCEEIGGCAIGVPGEIIFQAHERQAKT